MSKLKPIYKDRLDDQSPIIGYEFYCEGCHGRHQVPIVADSGLIGSDALWTYNSNREKPTFQPSIHIRTGLYAGSQLSTEDTEAAREWNETISRLSRICHSFVTDGKISYCGDTTHRFSGQVIQLLNVEDWPK